MAAVLFPIRDFHIFLADNAGLDQVIGKMRRLLNLIQNAAGDVILSCDSKLCFQYVLVFPLPILEGRVVSAQHSEP